MIPRRELGGRLLGSRFARMLRLPYRRGLLVLAYHRIVEADPESFPFDYGVVSASPEEFRRQMEFVRRNFETMSFSDLRSLEEEGKPWPKRGLIVTFDDGYLDNHTNAFPILREFAIPATIFLSTRFIGGTTPFWWDLVAYCLKRTPLLSVRFEQISSSDFPLGGRWERLAAIDQTLKWIKRVPDDIKNEFVASVPKALAVDLVHEGLPRMHLSWDEVREMSEHKIEFGSHTVTHPVLANVGPSQLQTEVERSKLEIEEQIGKQVIVFSYPVGNKGNFNKLAQESVKRAGYHYAVSYIEGIAGMHPRDAFAIPRIHVDAGDTEGIFTANLIFPRLMLRDQPANSL